jgi:tetratricopeptide (TPR) repeat protein
MHVATPARLAELLAWQCGADVSPQVLRATELRLAGNALASGGNLEARRRRRRRRRACARCATCLLRVPLNTPIAVLQLSRSSLSHLSRRLLLARSHPQNKPCTRTAGQEALGKYSAALEVPGDWAGRHLLLCNRSAVLLQLGRKDAALSDARAAVAAAPRGHHTSHVRLIDCLFATGQLEEARGALVAAEAADPGFRAAPEYKAIVKALGVKPAGRAGQ